MSRGFNLLVAAALSAPAAAQPPTETLLRYEARTFNSGIGSPWTSSLTALPGDYIEIRAVVSYTGSTTVHGLGQIIFQPVIDNWSPSDVLITQDIDGVGPSTLQGIGPAGSNASTPPGCVPDSPGVYGRITPWAGATTTTSNYYRGHVHENPDGTGRTYLRIARSDVTNWIGVGPSSGAGAANNINGAGGVTVAQGTIGAGRPTNFPPQNNNLVDIVVFKFAIEMHSTDFRMLHITTPPLGIGRSTTVQLWGQPDVRWYSAPDQTAPGLYRTDVQVTDGIINYIPSPASGLSGLLAFMSRRRR